LQKANFDLRFARLEALFELCQDERPDRQIAEEHCDENDVRDENFDELQNNVTRLCTPSKKTPKIK